MKRDKLNYSKSHASVTKTTLLAVLFFGCTHLVADDSATSIYRLNKLAKVTTCDVIKSDLHDFAQRISTLFADFFDISNNETYLCHAKRIDSMINDLEHYSKNTCLDKQTKKELDLIIKDLKELLKTLNDNTKSILKKGKQATYADLMGLAMPFKKIAKFIPDTYCSSISSLLTPLLHRIRCTENDEPTAKRQKIMQ